ncbi:MAG TPA: alkaline phosphatase D family protein [Actinomycetes bacterium]|nr:alkaline phosphatase D family protein [Actinomycetes bacterium]
MAAPASPSPAFRHGVASGDPLPDGVVIWTRVTPTPDALPGSGSGPAVDVRWEVATDPGFRRVVRKGTVGTGPARDHTVKVDVRGLAAGTDHYYRFHLGKVRSPVGRARTAPHALAAVARLRLGVVSCSNWQAGYFSPYRHLADRGDLDAVLHLGDYLYEYGRGEYGARGVDVRGHEPAHEMRTLADYRARHAQYKTDPDLQRLHAACPWIVTWDDHESANDAWRDGAENHTEGAEGSWAQRAAWARQAYAEWMPVRDADPLYRRLRFGQLAELSMLDLRTYRSQQVSTAHVGPGVPVDLSGIDDPSRSITGDAQLQWLKDGLLADAQWKLVGNPVMIAPVVFPPLPAEVSRPVADMTGLYPPDGVPYNVDQWDGYTADRRELFTHLADHGVQDTVFLTGDIHSSWACDLPLDAGTYPASRSVGTELVCTSVTSDNLDDLTKSPPRTTSVTVEEGIKANNRHVKYLEFDSHGYSVLDITPERVQMDWFYVADRTSPSSAAAWAASYAVPAGTQQAQRVAGPVR